LIAAAAALVLAFFAACGDLETFHGRLIGRQVPPNVFAFAPGAAVMPMQWVEPGSFTLGQGIGSSSSSVFELTNVTLTQGFYMGRYPVTRGQWTTVLAGNPNSIPAPHPSWGNAIPNTQEWAAGGDMNRRPATHVSWYDAIVFANWLSIAHGLAPAYELRCASNNQWTTDPARWGTVPASWDTRWHAARIHPTANGYRLPTEAQWEWAAKGGDTGEEFTFSGSNISGDVAWGAWNGGGSPRMVGLLGANGLGIHDMSGNVQEWTQSWWSSSHPGTPQIDPVGATSGDHRVLRGGSWNSSFALSLHSVGRGGSSAGNRWDDFGFRLVRLAP